MNSPTRYAEGITQRQVCDELGIKPRKLRRWMQMGMVRPSVRNSNGGKLAHGEPNSNVFSRHDWLGIKTVVALRQAQVGVPLIKKVVEYIRQQDYSLEPGVVHQIGRVIWSNAVVVVGKAQYNGNNQVTVFLEWGRLVRQAEAVFNRYNPPADDTPDDDLAWKLPADGRSIGKRLAEAQDRY